jgi:hypothetical protein
MEFAAPPFFSDDYPGFINLLELLAVDFIERHSDFDH